MNDVIVQTFQRSAMLHLHGEVKITVTKVGNKQEEMISYVYDLLLIDSIGEIAHFRVYGVDRISTGINANQYRKCSLFVSWYNRKEREEDRVEKLMSLLGLHICEMRRMFVD